MTLFHLWLSFAVKIFLELVHESFPQCIFLPHTDIQHSTGLHTVLPSLHCSDREPEQIAFV